MSDIVLCALLLRGSGVETLRLIRGPQKPSPEIGAVKSKSERKSRLMSRLSVGNQDGDRTIVEIPNERMENK